MSRKQVKYIPIPAELLARVEEVVKSGKYGYISASDFVRDAVRKQLRELGYYP